MAKRIGETALKREIRNVENRIKTIEKHTGAKITINKDAILSNPSKAKALAELRKISWKTLKQGKGFKHDFINMTVEGKYWSAKAGFIETETEVQGKDAVQLLKAVAKRERITKEKKQISISGQDNIEKAIDYFNYFKTQKQYEAHERKKAFTVTNNFVNNLKDMMTFGDITEEEKQKLQKLIHAIRRDPVKYKKIIEEKKLYDIAGVNMYDSDEQLVDLKENYDLIMDALLTEIGNPDEIEEEELKRIRKKADKGARDAVKAKAKQKGTKRKVGKGAKRK